MLFLFLDLALLFLILLPGMILGGVMCLIVALVGLATMINWLHTLSDTSTAVIVLSMALFALWYIYKGPVHAKT